MNYEQDTIHRIQDHVDTGESRTLVWDRKKKTIHTKSIFDDPDNVMDITPEDREVSST